MSPAPWTYDLNPGRARALILDADGFVVAYCLRTGPTDITADLELMTAAPDLLAALTRTLDLAIGHACEARKINAEECESWPWVQKARAAIAKATYTQRTAA